MVRFKNRYLLFEMVWKDGRVDDSLTDANVASAIRDSVGINFGDVGFSRALGSFQVKYVNPVTNLCIVRCSREDVKEIWASITFVSEVRRRALFFQLLHMGGTIKSCQRAALKYDQAILDRILNQSWGPPSADRITLAQNKLSKLKDLQG